MESPEQRSVFQVSDLVGTLRHGLEMTFPKVWVEGEISNFLAARSGHWYFTLKDDGAQIRCCYFRFARGATPQPADGQQVLVRGKASIYAQRGDLQLILDHLEDGGEGALRRAFEALKRKLADEGLFATQAKKPLPQSPRRIGLITSAQGAAIHDVLSTLRRRNPLLELIVYPAAVQGVKAPAAIIAALQTAQRRAECDVLLITRGGGSLEDLQAFNDENVARAIAACHLPTLSAIGHEVDVTIADFVADERAATPTAAAERLSPDSAEWHGRVVRARQALQGALLRRAGELRRDLRQRRLRLVARHPQRQLERQAQGLDELGQRARRTVARQQRERGQRVQRARERLYAARPSRDAALRRAALAGLRHRLRLRLAHLLDGRRRQLDALARSCQAYSPQHTLARGYAIARQGGKILSRRAELRPDQDLELQMQDGNIDLRPVAPKSEAQ